MVLENSPITSRIWYSLENSPITSRIWHGIENSPITSRFLLQLFFLRKKTIFFDKSNLAISLLLKHWCPEHLFSIIMIGDHIVISVCKFYDNKCFKCLFVMLDIFLQYYFLIWIVKHWLWLKKLQRQTDILTVFWLTFLESIGLRLLNYFIFLTNTGPSIKA